MLAHRFGRQSIISSTIGLFAISALAVAICRAEPGTKPSPADSRELKSPSTAATVRIEELADAAVTGRQGYLGVTTEVDSKGRLVVKAVGQDSPALKCGVQIGDMLMRADGKTVASPAELRKMIQANRLGTN